MTAPRYGKIEIVGYSSFYKKGPGDFIETTISGMTGRGSIRHNNRSFSAANVDRSRSEQNITFCNDDLKQVYHELFDEALAAITLKRKRPGTKYQTTMSISGRANRRSYFTRPSSRSVTWRTVGAAPQEGNGQRQLSKNLQSPSRSAILICGYSIWCCTWMKPRPTSM